MDATRLNDVKHWLDRAEEARTLAADMKDPKTKATMLEIAQGYEKMAEHARARLAKATGP